MREIKFRACDIRSGEWHIGSYVHDEEWARHYIYKQVKKGVFFKCTPFEINPKTVGQYTGLKDKNGVEIYEGDILAIPEFYDTPEMASTTYLNHQVVFLHGSFNLSYKDKMPDMDDYTLYQEYMNYDERFLVVGNIHDNPEFSK